MTGFVLVSAAELSAEWPEAAVAWDRMVDEVVDPFFASASLADFSDSANRRRLYLGSARDASVCWCWSRSDRAWHDLSGGRWVGRLQNGWDRVVTLAGFEISRRLGQA